MDEGRDRPTPTGSGEEMVLSQKCGGRSIEQGDPVVSGGDTGFCLWLTKAERVSRRVVPIPKA